MKINRRDLIVSGGLGAASLILTPRISIGKSNLLEDHFFLLIQADGGMDVTLGLDPKVHQKGTDQKDIFLEYRPEDILRASNGLLLGPAAAPLLEHAESIAIINGIVMRRDVGHDSLLDYISSGSGDRSLPYISVEIAKHQHETPLGVMINDSILTGNLTPVLSQIPRLDQFERAANYGSEYQVYEQLVDQSSGIADVMKSFMSFKDTRAEFIRIFKELSEANGGSFNEISGVAAALASGSASSAFLNLGDFKDLDIDLDTHAQHERRHAESQIAVWSTVADIFSMFKNVPYKSGSLFDVTTFMVVSEFSRTPYLNGAKGKDHNVFTNSVLLAGKGVQPGKVHGGSHVIKRGDREDGRALHIGSPIDYSTGQVTFSKDGANLIFPENVMKSLYSIFGLPKHDFYPDINVATIPGVSKS